MTLALVIANKNYSSWSLRPWLALKTAEIPFDEIVIPLDTPDTKARLLEHSPAAKAPILIDDDLKIWESLAILEYVAERFPQARLWPDDHKARAHARTICSEMHAGFQALRRHYPMNVRKRIPGRAPTPQVQADVDRILAMWSACRARFGAGGPFLFGHFTAADAMYAPVVSRFETYVLNVDPVIRAYMDAMFGLPAFKEWTAAAHAETWIIEDEEATAD